MIIVWCVLTILIIMLTVSIMLILSTIQFEINNFIFDSTRPKKRKVSKFSYTSTWEFTKTNNKIYNNFRRWCEYK